MQSTCDLMQHTLEKFTYFMCSNGPSTHFCINLMNILESNPKNVNINPNLWHNLENCESISSVKLTFMLN